MKLFDTIKAAAAALALTATAAAAQTTMETIQANNVLRVGLADSLPFQYKDAASGEWKGFNVDMAHKAAEALGVELEIVDATWATIIPGLTGGRYDVAFVDMFATPQRAATVMFTDSYYNTRAIVLTNQNTDLASWEELDTDGKAIVVLAGTADEAVAKEKFPNAETRPVVAEGVASVILEVAGNRADATILSEMNIRLYLAANPNAPLKILEEGRGIPAQGFSYAVRPGDDHLLNFMNTFIRSSYDTGLRDEMENKWIKNFPG